jgi:SAM-dependent methyltransferase
LHYAQNGHQVRAFDIDPRMGAAFAERCARPMAAGQVQLLCTTYREFLASSFAHASVDLITANFAPLNVIDDLPELFGKFHAMTRPGGRIIASLLNPSYLGDMRFGWWWRLRPQLARTGGYEMRGEAYTLHRWTPARLAALALPHFDLHAVHRGLPQDWLARVPPRHWLSRHTSQFLFIEFTRRQGSPTYNSRPNIAAARSHQDGAAGPRR